MIKTKISEEVRRLIDYANSIHSLDMSYPEIRYDLTGLRAGTASSKWILRFNLHIASQNEEEFLSRTVPHEIAHLVVYKKYGIRKVAPHGLEWRNILRSLGAKDVKRTHNYDMSKVPVRRQLRFTALCACDKPHEISTTLRNKMLRGYGYRCRGCGERLKLK